MSRNAPILFTPVGFTSTGRRLYKLCHRGRKVFGHAFCIGRPRANRASIADDPAIRPGVPAEPAPRDR
jgi:hypothetical protein